MALTPTIYELACQAVGADLSRPLPIYRPFKGDKYPHDTVLYRLDR